MEPMVIRKEVEIEAPVERVWPFVGTQAGLQKWWLPHRVTLEERVGILRDYNMGWWEFLIRLPALAAA